MRRYDVEAIVGSICDVIADYAASRQLSVEKAVELYDCIMAAIDEFDECNYCYDENVYDVFDDAFENDVYNDMYHY